ncbi:MAG: hypothetical protein IT323_14675, partial [Anaerolineae bacterium]|nr:hypothetical protein [Anaerolineae bacterium]
LREWTRLRGWLDESRADVRTQRLLAGAAAEWTSAARDPSYLLHGSRLAQVAGWAQGTSVALTGDERDYLVTSVRAEQRAVALRRRVRRAVAVMSLVVAVVMTFLALAARQEAALRQQAQAEAERSAADYRRMALVNGSRAALTAGDTDTALALALEANRDAAPPGTAQIVLAQAAYRPGTVRQAALPVNWMVIHPSGKLAMARRAGSPGWMVLNADPDSDRFGEVLATPPIPDGVSFKTGPVFSPDGKLAFLAARGIGEPMTEAFLMNTDLDSPDFLKTVPVAVQDGDQLFASAAFSPDSRILILGGCAHAVGSDQVCHEGELLAWQIDPETLALGDVLNRAAAPFIINMLTFTPDQARALVQTFSPAQETAVRLVEMNPASTDFGRVVHTFSDTDAGTGAISPDGKTALLSQNAAVTLWSLENFQKLRDFESPGYNSAVAGVEFDPSGRYALCFTNANIIVVYDTDLGMIVTRLEGHAWEIRTAHFTPGGRYILSGSIDAIRLWNVERTDTLRTFDTFILPFPAGIPRFGSFSPDGRTLAVAGECFSGCDTEWMGAALYDVATGQEMRRFGGYPFGTLFARYSPDGEKLLAADTYGYANVWDVQTGALISVISDPTTGAAALPINDALFSPDSRYVLITPVDGNQIGVWDIAQNPAVEVKRIPDEPYTGSLAFVYAVRQGNRALATGSTPDGDVLIWDVETGEQLAALRGHTGRVRALSAGPEGRTLLTGGFDSALILWNIDLESPAFGTEIRRFSGQPSVMFWVQMSPDGRYVYADSYGRGVRQWDAATGELLRHYEDLTGLIFAPDGRTFVSMNIFTYKLMLLRVDTLDELKAWIAERRYVRDFTCEERAQYDIPPLCETQTP